MSIGEDGHFSYPIFLWELLGLLFTEWRSNSDLEVLKGGVDEAKQRLSAAPALKDAPDPLPTVAEMSPAQAHELMANLNRLAADVYNPNESYLNEIPIATFKYILVPYLHGLLLTRQKFVTPEERRAMLLGAKVHLSLFLVDVFELVKNSVEGNHPAETKLFKLNDGDLKIATNVLEPPKSWASAEERRDMVISRHALLREYVNVLTGECASDGLKEEDSDEARQFWITLLKLCWLEARAEIDFIGTELQILDARRDRPPTPVAAEPSSIRVDGTGKILDKPFIIKIRNNAELRRYFGSRVFEPFHNLPTVSLAEAAAIEMAQDVGIIGAAQKRSMRGMRERPPGSDESDESEGSSAADSASEAEARRWDDWKDENPKGSGNKDVNRG